MRIAKRWGVLIAAAVLLAASLGINVFGAGAAGSESDPLVSKAYVDSVAEELRAEIKELKEAQNAEGTAAPQSTAVFTAVQVPAGQSLIGGAGTELVLRSGKATAIDNGADGVSDLTGAKDLKGGTEISLNHLLLVPRDDGRGISCSQACWVMVKGDYTIR